jgi:very-short-patch-repair endonuclease
MASPIEHALFNAIAQAKPEEFDLIYYKSSKAFVTDDNRVEMRGRAKEQRTGPDDAQPALIYYNAQVATYRVDLLMETNGGLLLAIECDGHEFHDRTKQQAAYDRARDRELLRRGIRTARFTGSEIHHYAEKCAHEVWALFSLLHNEEDKREGAEQFAFMNGVDVGERRAMERAQSEAFDFGFSRGVKHAAQAYSTNLEDFAEEHW